MHGTRHTLFLEPGEAEIVRKLLTQAVSAAADRGVGQAPAMVLRAEVAAALDRLLQGPATPLPVLRSATRREAWALLRGTAGASMPPTS